MDKEASGKSNETQQFAPLGSPGARTASKPAVAVTPDEIVEDSEDGQVDDNAAEGGKAVESTAEESVAE